MEDCKEELHTLLQEDVRSIFPLAVVCLTVSTDRGLLEHPCSYSQINRISMGRWLVLRFEL